MKIQTQDMYYGAALMQVVEHPRFKALNKAADGKYGHYILNNDTHLFIKYSSGSGPEYRFTLSAADLAAISRDRASGHRVFAVFVCGEETICAISSEDFFTIVDATASGSQQVRVTSEEGKSMRFGRGRNKPVRTVPHNSYPNAVLGS